MWRMRYVDPRYPLSELTRDVIAGFYRTYDALGFGFLELPYKRALSVEAQAAAGGLAFLSAVSAQCQWCQRPRPRATFILPSRSGGNGEEFGPLERRTALLHSTRLSGNSPH